MDGLGEASRSSCMQNLYKNEMFVLSEANQLRHIQEIHGFETRSQNWCFY
jgi:hypothetical protein